MSALKHVHLQPEEDTKVPGWLVLDGVDHVHSPCLHAPCAVHRLRQRALRTHGKTATTDSRRTPRPDPTTQKAAADLTDSPMCSEYKPIKLNTLCFLPKIDRLKLRQHYQNPASARKFPALLSFLVLCRLVSNRPSRTRTDSFSLPSVRDGCVE